MEGSKLKGYNNMKTTIIINLGLLIIAYGIVGYQPEQLTKFFALTFGFSIVSREIVNTIKI
jgi:hypothetical protein